MAQPEKNPSLAERNHPNSVCGVCASLLHPQIYKAMIEKYDKAEALACAEEEWVQDSKGDGRHAQTY